ncbi:MAG: hypothetical protein AAF810_00940 [Cyanobacteria bacterium P01_D01_bin.36]
MYLVDKDKFGTDNEIVGAIFIGLCDRRLRCDRWHKVVEKVFTTT